MSRKKTRSINFGLAGRDIAWACFGASLVNCFVNSSTIRSVVFCVLGVAMLCVILQDTKTEKELLEENKKLFIRNSYFESMIFEFYKVVEEDSNLTEEQKEKVNNMFWDVYHSTIENAKKVTSDDES